MTKKWINKFKNTNIDAVFVLLILFFLVASWYKAELVDKITGNFAGCQNCFQMAMYEQDAWHFFLISLFLFIGSYKNIYVKRTGRFLALGLMLIYMADVYTIINYATRFYISDAVKYINVKSVIYFAKIRPEFFAIVFIFVLLAATSLIKKQNNSKTYQIIMAITSILLLAFSLYPKSQAHVDNFLLKNIITIQNKSSEGTPYSKNFEFNLIKKHGENDFLNCYNSPATSKKNIIMVVVESLSPYQSKLMTGLNDWTPHIDSMAQEGLLFRNFFANDYNSDFARIAILTGEIPLAPVPKNKSGISRNLYTKTARTLPLILQDQGYLTYLISGSNLDIKNVERYMRKVGFENIEDSREARYKTQPKYAFDSISDDLLYQRILELSSAQKAPYFLMALTVTSHEPFVDPVSGQRSVEKVIRYADTALHNFYQALKKTDFFENGMLIITADHRSMTPIYKDEQKLLGAKAVANIPLIVLGQGFAGVSDAYLQQADFLHSFQAITAPTYCKQAQRGLIFSQPPEASRCTYHAQGGFRDRVSTYCDQGAQIGVVQLNGDNTQAIRGEVPAFAVDTINLARIREARRQ